MNDLERIFRQNQGRLIHKWDHYFEVYDRHFSRYRDTDVHVVEFGVSQGGSLQMWKEYFGAKATIVGVDINAHCKRFADEQIQVFIGDQDDREFLRSLPPRLGRIDILIDDGGRRMSQQINTLEELFPRIDPHGVYVCEDLHTSYWPQWGGGYRRRGTFIEHSKKLIDAIHAWHSVQDKFHITGFTRSAHSLHYYDSMLVIEKRPMSKSTHSKTGSASIPEFHPKPLAQRVKTRVRRELERRL